MNISTSLIQRPSLSFGHNCAPSHWNNAGGNAVNNSATSAFPEFLAHHICPSNSPSSTPQCIRINNGKGCRRRKKWTKSFPTAEIQVRTEEGSPKAAYREKQRQRREIASLLTRCWSGSKLASVLFNLESLAKAMSVPEMLSSVSGSGAGSLRKSCRRVKSLVLSHGWLMFRILFTPWSNSKIMMMFSVIPGLLFFSVVSCWGRAILMTVMIMEWANTASQFNGVRLSRACWNGAKALLWYCSAMSMYGNAAGVSAVAVARCNAATASTPFSRKLYSRAFCGMTICHAWWSDGSLQRLWYVSVENLCISPKSPRPKEGCGAVGSSNLGSNWDSGCTGLEIVTGAGAWTLRRLVVLP